MSGSSKRLSARKGVLVSLVVIDVCLVVTVAVVTNVATATRLPPWLAWLQADGRAWWILGALSLALIGLAVFHRLVGDKVDLDDDPAELLKFARIALASDNPADWCEIDPSTRSDLDQDDNYWLWRKLHARDRGDPYQREYDQHFSLQFYTPQSDPFLDIVVLNNATSPMLLNRVGIEVVSVANIAYQYGAPQASHIEMQDAYVIEMPDVWGEIQGAWRSRPTRRTIGGGERDGIGPIEIKRVVSKMIPDPVCMDPGIAYRYKLVLLDYCRHMPNGTIIRIYAKTDRGEHFSHPIYVFTA